MEFIPEKDTPILVVDDDPGLLLSIRSVLVSAGFPDPGLVSDGRKVMGVLKERCFQLLLLDLLMPHVTGMELIEQVKRHYPDTECVIITALDEVDSAVQAMRFGAFDYLVKPVEPERLIITVKNALERNNLRLNLSLYQGMPTRAVLKNPEVFREMVAVDETMTRVFHQVETCAPTDYSLLVTGETGVGKDMVARIVHRLSRRSDGPFVAVNMASFSRTLFEDELFGHARGAFTGALSERKGFFEEAHGGSLFLDEITELERDLQGKLLRVIEEKELYRLGSTRARDADVRIIGSTNRDIFEEVREERFRRDLLHRLNICHIHIPALRERKKDILPLARHFLKRHAEKNKKEIFSIAPEMERVLEKYPFPGNVRELENIIAASVIAEKGKSLTLSSVPREVVSIADSVHGMEEPLPLFELEKRHILRVLESAGGNRTRAARILGIGLRTLQRKLRN